MDYTSRVCNLLSVSEGVSRSALLRKLRTVSSADLDVALGRMADRGQLVSRQHSRARGRPVTLYTLRGDADVVPARLVLRDDLHAEQRAAEAQVMTWIAGLGDQARNVQETERRRAVATLCMDLIVALYRAPHRYGAKVLAETLRPACDEGVWRAALRKLAEMDVIDLAERKDDPSKATLSLKTPPPMAMAG